MTLAGRTAVVTQMGNQGHSGNNYFQFKAWTETGVIADVTRIVAFMNDTRQWHGWKVDGYPEGEPLPPGLDWDLWHASRPARPYSPMYHPKKWRGWFAYGTGALGDWGAHIIDTAQPVPGARPANGHRGGQARPAEPRHLSPGHHAPVRVPRRADRKPPVELWWYDARRTGLHCQPNSALVPRCPSWAASSSFRSARSRAARTATRCASFPSRGAGACDEAPKITGGLLRPPHELRPSRARARRGALAVQRGGRADAGAPVGYHRAAGGRTARIRSGAQDVPQSPEATATARAPPPREGWERYYR